MPYRQYLSKEDSEPITATQAEHDGHLIETNQDFFTGDWIIKHPVNLLGQITHSIMNDEEFKRKYKTSTQTNAEIFAQFGYVKSGK
jgi:hypothetical protein